MAIKKTRKRTVHYREALYEPHGELFAQIQENRTLQELLSVAVQNLENADKALIRVHPDDREEALSLVNGKLPCEIGFDFPSSALFSVLPDDGVAAAATDEYGMHITSAHAHDPHSGKKLDPARDITIFAVKGNHVAYVSSLKNADEKLTRFFSWLLQKETRVLDSSFVLNLNAKFKTAVGEKFEKVGIKKILLTTSRVKSSDDAIIAKAKKLAVDAIVCPDVSITRRQALENCEFALTITPGVREQGVRQEALRYYCSKMSDRQLLEMRIEFADGTKYDGGTLFVDGKVKVEYDGNVIMQGSAQRAISNWLRDFLKSKI